MASNFDVGLSVDTTDAADFIPEIWALETVAAYKKNLVLAKLVSLIPHIGKKGDTINIPFPTRGAAVSKAANTVVAPITYADTTSKTISLNNHYYYARLLEDIVELQALPSLRRFFTDDSGYALAKQTDTSIAQLAKTWGGGTNYSKAVIGSDGSTAWTQASSGNGAALSDAGIRRVMQTLDDNDVPGRDRFLCIPPIEKRKLLAEARFTEQSFVGEEGKSIRDGFVRELYGFDIYVSTNVPQTQANDSTVYNVCLAFQRDSLVLAEQQTVRVQEQYKLEALGSLVVADCVYGVATIRGDTSSTAGAGCKAIVVPNS